MPRNYTDQNKIDIELGWLNVESENKAKYLLLTDSKLSDVAAKAKVALPPGYRLVRSEGKAEKFTIALLCDTTSEIVYYINCTVWEEITLNSKPVTQTILWRTNDVVHRRVTSGVTEDIFRNYLLETYNIVASDNAQTQEGRDFWIRQLGYALQYDEFVYRYDLINSNLCRILDHATIRDNSCDLWGDEEEYQGILALISKEELRIKK